MAWTSPQHVAGGALMPSADINAQIIDNLQFLHDGFPFVLCECEDLSQQVVPIANRAIAVPVVPRDAATIAGLTYRSSSTAGNIDVGIYIDDGNGTTATRLKSSGSTAMPAGASAHTVNFTASQTVDTLEKYWLAMAWSSGSARVLGTDGPYSLLCKIMDTAFPLPATFTFGATPAVAPCLAGLS